MTRTKTASPAAARTRRMARQEDASAQLPAPDAVPPDKQATAPDASTPPRPTKASAVLEMLQRSDGASLAELAAATGWQVHSVRAHLTGLRKKGHTLVKSERDNAACYRVESN